MNAETSFDEQGRAVETMASVQYMADVACGGCGHLGVSAVVRTSRVRGYRTWSNERSVYCDECGRHTPEPVKIEAFPIGGWQAMAEALRERPRMKPFSIIQGGKV